MKTNKGLIVVIPLVLLVWGVLFYRVFSSNNDDPELVNKNERFVAPKKQYREFELSHSERDPFAANNNVRPRARANVGSVVRTVTTTTSAKNKASEIKWPLLKYLGLFKNNNDNREVVMMNINERTYTMKTGDVARDVKLVKVFKDSVLVMFNKERKIIRR